MSVIIKLAAACSLLAAVACSQQEEPAPAPVVEPEPVFTGKM